MTQDPVVAIVGAGPGGTCCAAMLEVLGVSSFIIERGTFPRFTLGESLLPVSLDHLEEAGLLDAVHQEDFIRKPGAIFVDEDVHSIVDFRKTKNIRYPYAFNLRRDRFDATLAEAVEKRGVPIHWNTTLTAASYADRRWTLTTEGPGGVVTFEADFVVDASGAALIPRLSGGEIAAPITSGDRRGSVFAHLRDPHRPDGFEAAAVWIVSTKTDLWEWVIPFSDGTASVGFVASESEILEAGDDTVSQFEALRAASPVCSGRFADPEIVRVEPRAVFGFRRPFNVPHGPGYCLVGNSIGFVDPVFSSGVLVATESAIRAAHGIKADLLDNNFDWVTGYTEPLLAGIDVLVDCADCWYDGTLKQLIYAQETDLPYKSDVTSLLAGAAWDRTNSLTKDTAWSLRYLVGKLEQRRQRR